MSTRLSTYIPATTGKKSGVADGGEHTNQLHRDPDVATLEGISLRRMLKIEPMHRKKQTVYIEEEILQNVKGDLNFQINLALEHIITKHQGAQVAVSKMED